MIDSKIVLHSISQIGLEAITYEITIPKWMVAEVNTHKAEIERNSASSRAIPTATIIKKLEDDPFVFPTWYYNESGMTANESMDEADSTYMTKWWKRRLYELLDGIDDIQLPSGKRPSKQQINRALEAWMWTKLVITFTLGGGIGFNNFMALRDHKDAQPEFRTVAHMMHEQYHESERNLVRSSDVHFPYVDNETAEEVKRYLKGTEFRIVQEKDFLLALGLVSAARCGRVTYMKQGAVYSIDEEITRGQSFSINGHFSPLRHPLIAGQHKWYGNQYGWIPISKMLTPTGIDYKTKCCELAK